LQRTLDFAPDRRDDFGDLAVGHVRQAGKHLAKISVGIESTAAAAFDDGVDDGAALAGLGVADEKPVFLVMTSSS
jgi:hypothetical protein